MIFNILYEKESFLLFSRKRLFLPCPKSNQFFLRAAPIDCKKSEESTRSSFWVIVLINLFVFLFSCFLVFLFSCLLTESVFCDFLGNGWTNSDSVFCKRCKIRSTNFYIVNLFSYFASLPRKTQKTGFSIWTKTIYSHVVHGVNIKIFWNRS